jgi:hypothetical protein
MPEIKVTGRDATKGVFRGEPIMQHQYFLEFDITVEKAGCYALDVRLFDHDTASFDDPIGLATGGTMPCFCFEAGTAKKFYVTGAGGPIPPGEKGYTSTGTQLPSIEGVWPPSDGPGDNGIEIFSRIYLFLCKEGACTAAEGCDGIPRPDDPDDAIADWHTFRSDVRIINGTGMQELVDIFLGILGKVGVFFSLLPISSRRGADFWRSQREVDRRLARVERHLGLEKREDDQPV